MRDRDIAVVLVNEYDEVVGYGDKLEVHRKGLLHRAFSVLIFNQKNELLIQRRSDFKYHAAGLWANTCCGHPFPGEGIETAATRRLFEEIGLRCYIEPLTHIYYKKSLDHGMIEHEYVHVFRGQYDNEPFICDPHEVAEHRWINLQELKQDVQLHPNKYAAWFAHYVQEYFDSLFSYENGK